MGWCGTPGCHGTSGPVIGLNEDGDGPALWVTCACGCGDECHPISWSEMDDRLDDLSVDDDLGNDGCEKCERDDGGPLEDDVCLRCRGEESSD